MKQQSNSHRPACIDDLHPSLTTHQLGVWTMVTERKMQLKFAAPTVHFVGLWGSRLAGNASVLSYFLEDCRKIFGTPLSCAYVGYQLFRGLKKTALLYVAGQVMQTIEEAIVTKQPDINRMLWMLGLQLGLTVVSQTADWAIHKIELSMQSKLKRHFMLLQMRAMLRLDYPTFQVASDENSGITMHSESLWNSFSTIVEIFHCLVSTTSQLWMVSHLTRNNGSLLFAASCIASPVISVCVGDTWSYDFVAHIVNGEYTRSHSFFDLATGSDYKQEVLTGAMDEYVLNEYSTSAKYLGNQSEEHPYSQLRVPSTPIYDIFLDVIGNLPTLYYALHVIFHPGTMTLASLAMLQQTSQSLNQTFGSFSFYYSMLRESVTMIQGVYDGLKIQNEIEDGTVAYPDPALVLASRGMGIEFKDMSFSYPSAPERLVLKNVSFRLKPCSMVVIVGANGSGKSTLVKLLSSLYRPTSGSFLIDDLPASTYRLRDLRQRIALLTQDHNLFPLTLGENIGVGDPSDVGNLEKIKEAAQLGGAVDVVHKMENGFEETIGQHSDVFTSNFTLPAGPLKDLYVKLSRKSEVSGGEKQRLVASRTFRRILSGKMRLVLVDEPTSAMDPEGEFKLFEKLREMRGTNTMVFVTHRFGHLTKHADLILCMKDGRTRRVWNPS